MFWVPSPVIVGNVVTRRADAEGRAYTLTRRSTTAQYAVLSFVRVCACGTRGSLGADRATVDLVGVLPGTWPECKTRNSVVPAARRSAVAIRTRVLFRFVGIGVQGLAKGAAGQATSAGPYRSACFALPRCLRRCV